MGRPFQCKRLAHLPRYMACVYAVLFKRGVVKIGTTCWPRQRVVQLEREMGDEIAAIEMRPVDSCIERHARERSAICKAHAVTAPMNGRIEYFDSLSFSEAVSFIEASKRGTVAA